MNQAYLRPVIVTETPKYYLVRKCRTCISEFQSSRTEIHYIRIYLSIWQLKKTPISNAGVILILKDKYGWCNQLLVYQSQLNLPQ